ncbi:hypothetical protein PUNSTDRAFT_56913 [Punctularia strigosozonata HHB-11173 SS5]|uniref:uncharacterized protein n=1 Tax=Punctularia strigosozonata (strain HHB-11173) TaxID=741275 RepID=UPI0004416FC7|nr:uncharacterized protein PUNSTDRAFT_56913 [Punctularia strigosozonata HHB-11173 SS5]EIN13553.1 hypothetical protein PUNSTDRAFT_56913 [Punctularia strigosozonata HHB-11173 SS5]
MATTTPVPRDTAYSVEIGPKRPSRTLARTLQGLLGAIVFDIGCLMINGTQFAFLLPLRLLPFEWADKIYEDGIRYTKGAFGNLLILMCQWFSPTRLVVSFETEGEGAWTTEELERIVVRDGTGKVTRLDLPRKSVFIANHQVLHFRWYAWCFLHYCGMSKDIFIVLKNSLRWIPVVGWGMRFFNFIFLARSWNSDRLALTTSLAKIGRRAETEDTPFAFLLYPEGTLVSRDTRPISKKFADKEGIPDMIHTLLPRSTGLQYSLRSLAPRIPSLQLIDITMAYPGVPPMGYGQSYYTLRSIFLDGIPPPSIHLHLRRFDVRRDVPIGDLSATDPSYLPAPSKHTQTVEIDVPEAEKIAFERWLRDLWRTKDALLDRWHRQGSLVSDSSTTVKMSNEVIEIPLRLRNTWEVLDAFCFFLPALVCYVWSRLRGQ